ncbi:MAG: hypothetical protein AB1522_04475 [Chloroflexota bacterium]
MLKRIFELTIEDFKAFPVWTWAEEDDESLVIPWQQPNAIENHDAFFVMATLHLRDHSQIEGMIAVRTSDLSVYSIAISNEKGDLIDFPLQGQTFSLKGKKKLAKYLNRALGEVFPLSYESHPEFPKTIKGIIV